MKTYCLVCKENTENINKLLLLSQCSVCKNRKAKFISKKEQEAEGLLSNLRIRTPLSNIPELNILF